HRLWVVSSVMRHPPWLWTQSVVHPLIMTHNSHSVGSGIWWTLQIRSFYRHQPSAIRHQPSAAPRFSLVLTARPSEASSPGRDTGSGGRHARASRGSNSGWSGGEVQAIFELREFQGSEPRNAGRQRDPLAAEAAGAGQDGGAVEDVQRDGRDPAVL